MNDPVEHPTTTHAEFGAGRPRLIFTVDPEQWSGEGVPEFELLDPVTRIGSAPDMDLRLEGLDAFHAEIRHDERDEYVLFTHGAAELSSDLTTPFEGGDAEGRVLRTGAHIGLGPWQMSFYREEYADHGRPFGGREGGEGEHQPAQPARPAYREGTDGSDAPESP